MPEPAIEPPFNSGSDSRERWTLIPGDRVTFAGHEWEVFITLRGEQHDASPVYIFRYEHPGRASDVIDLLRQRCELRLIPRSDTTGVSPHA